MPSKTYPIYYYDIAQNSEEWHELRRGKFTASKADVLSVKGRGIGGLGVGAITHLYRKASEVITGDECKGDYNNVHMERGKDSEPLVIEMYEGQTFNNVRSVGFVQYSEHIGCSPDGLVGDKGMIEIKSPDNPEFLKRRLTWEMPKKHWCQIQFQLMCTGREWCDYILFNFQFGNVIWINRITPYEPLIKVLRENAQRVEKEIKNMERTMDFLLNN